MKRSSLFAAWGIAFIICAGLGFIPDAEGGVRIFLMILSVLFFVPPAILLYDARQQGDRKTICQIRLLSAASLGLTLALMIASILTALGGEWQGNLMHVLLVVFSTPMFCSNYWALSLFLWAALFFAALGRKRS